jgi:hypothetical protein
MARSPDLSPADRQAALDLQDAKISAIPKQPPILREPEPQEQFESRFVTASDGTEGYIKANGDFSPFEKDKSEQELEKEKRAFVGKTVAELTKIQEDEGSIGGETLDLQAMIGRATTTWDLMIGKTDPDENFIPELEPLWEGALSDLENAGAKVTEDDMLAMMQLYIEAAGRGGISPVEARYDFLQHWQSELGGSGRYSSVVPKMSAKTEKLFRTAGSDTVTLNDPIAGPGAAAQPTEQGPALPTTQAEYDALPSGTRYTDPQGNTGVKP